MDELGRIRPASDLVVGRREGAMKRAMESESTIEKRERER
jgi:hypothetical protein